MGERDDLAYKGQVLLGFIAVAIMLIVFMWINFQQVKVIGDLQRRVGQLEQRR